MQRKHYFFKNLTNVLRKVNTFLLIFEWILKNAPLWIRDSRILSTKRPLHYTSSIEVSISKAQSEILFCYTIEKCIMETHGFSSFELTSPRIASGFLGHLASSWQRPITLSDRARSLPDIPEMASNSLRYVHIPSPWLTEYYIRHHSQVL